MLPFSIGFGELVLIVVVLLLVVGPSRLPQIARTLAGAMRMARRATRELQDAISAEELKEPLVRPWEEVVKARDEMVDSLTREPHAEIVDAEMVDAHDDNLGEAPKLAIKPVDGLVQAGASNTASEAVEHVVDTPTTDSSNGGNLNNG